MNLIVDPSLLAGLAGLCMLILPWRWARCLAGIGFGIAAFMALLLPAYGLYGQADLAASPIVRMNLDATSHVFALLLALTMVVWSIANFGETDQWSSASVLWVIAAAMGAVIAADLVSLALLTGIGVIAIGIWHARGMPADRSSSSVRVLAPLALAGFALMFAGASLAASGLGGEHVSAWEALTTGSLEWTLTCLAFAILAGLPPAHVWMLELFGHLRIHSASVISICISMIGVYGLIRLANGQMLIIWVGLGAAALAAIMSLQEANLRRLLAYGWLTIVGLACYLVGLGGNAGIAAASAAFVGGALICLLFGFISEALSPRKGEAIDPAPGPAWRAFPGAAGLLLAGGYLAWFGPGSPGWIAVVLASDAPVTGPFPPGLIVFAVLASFAFHLGARLPTELMFARRQAGTLPVTLPFSTLLATAMVLAITLSIGLFPAGLMPLLPPDQPQITLMRWPVIISQLQMMAAALLAWSLLRSWQAIRTPTGQTRDIDWVVDRPMKDVVRVLRSLFASSRTGRRRAATKLAHGQVSAPQGSKMASAYWLALVSVIITAAWLVLVG